MKLLYVIGSIGATSMTFVTDLIDGLAEEVELTVLAQSVPSGYKPGNGAKLRLARFLNRWWLDKLVSRLCRDSSMCRINDRYVLSGRSLGKFREVLDEERPDAVFIEFGHNAVLLGPMLKQLGIPFFVHFHGLDITSYLQNPYYVRRLAYMFADVSGIVAASNHIRRLLVLSGAPEAKIQIVRLEPIDYYKQCQGVCDVRYSGPPSVVFLGRLTEKKHPLALLEAFRIVAARIEGARLTIIGNGPMRAELERRIICYGLSGQVQCLGALERDDALKVLASHWIYAQHSVTASDGDQEGFGVSIAEAALLKLPVASTLHNGIPEQVEHGKTGLLCREYNYEEMAEQLYTLLSNPSMCREYGDAGRQAILELCLSRSRAGEIVQMIEGRAARSIEL
jgi:glycosyltransferase involved in cell wall biosynthesis